MIDKSKNYIWLISSAITLIGFGFYNLCNNGDFFKAPLYVILNLAVALYVAFYFTQRRNDERKLKDIIESIIDKIQIMILNENAYIIDENTENKTLTMMQRGVKNKIKLLSDNKIKLNIVDEVNHINKQFEGYCDMIGNHIDDKGYLFKSQIELKNYLDIIDDKLDEIKIKFYTY